MQSKFQEPSGAHRQIWGIEMEILTYDSNNPKAINDAWWFSG